MSHNKRNITGIFVAPVIDGCAIPPAYFSRKVSELQAFHVLKICQAQGNEVRWLKAKVIFDLNYVHA